MKLWILRPVDGLDKDDNPWNPWFDKVLGFVIRAETEADARALAHSRAGVENRGDILSEKPANTNQPWMDAKYSTCTELLSEGGSAVIMRDFASS